MSRKNLSIAVLLTLGLLAGAFDATGASAELKIEKRTYRVHVTGQYLDEWQHQSSGFPEPAQPWSTETGRVKAGFSTPGGVIFKGIKWSGRLPGGYRPAPFTVTQVKPVVAKSLHTQSFKRKVNQVPGCGGELGECTGDEPKGIRATSDSCRRPNSKIPLLFDYDVDKTTDIKISFGSDRSMKDFCGTKYPATNSIDGLPEKFNLKNGLDWIGGLEKGEKLFRNRTLERGYNRPNDRFDGKAFSNKCPALSGPGTHECWTTDLTVEIKRIK